MKYHHKKYCKHKGDCPEEKETFANIVAKEYVREVVKKIGFTDKARKINKALLGAEEDN